MTPTKTKIKINNRDYFFVKYCNEAYTNPVVYHFYTLSEPARTQKIKEKKYGFFGPTIERLVQLEATYNFAFKTLRQAEFVIFPKEEIKALEQAYRANKEIFSGSFEI